MRSIFLIGCLFWLGLTTAQNDEASVDDAVNEFTQKLEARGIVDYFISKRYCNGHIEMFQIDGRMCVSRETYFEVYVVWTEEEGSFLKKIDNCGLFHSIPLATTELMDFFTKHATTISSETVKRYELANPETQPALRTEIQACFRNFRINTSEIEFSQTYNKFDLTTKEGKENIHFQSNNNLKLVQLEGQLSAQIKQLDNQFRRQ